MVALLTKVVRAVSIVFSTITIPFGVACQGDSNDQEAAATPDVPTVIGNPVWISSERADVPLSQITGMAVDAKQRVYAPDYRESAVFVFGADGTYLTRIGRKGSGPGEFERGCCAAFDPNERLWVKDAGNARYVVFNISGADATVVAKPAFVVPLPHQDPNWGPRLWIDTRNNVISIGHVTDPDRPTLRSVKHFFADTTGRVVQTIAEPTQTEDVTKPIEYTVGDRLKSTTLLLYQPFGARELRANGPDGAFALAGSGKYSVRWFSPTGELLHTITQELVGPELSLIDRAVGDSSLANIARNANTTVGLLPFKLPERKPPLYAIFFDEDRRLWVQHTTLQGMVQQADVYGPNGALVFRAAWPAGIRIATDGYVRGNTAWGLQLDDNDVPHVVRMEFTSGR